MPKGEPRFQFGSDRRHVFKSSPIVGGLNDRFDYVLERAPLRQGFS